MKKTYAVLAVLLTAAMVFPTMLGAQAPDTLPGQGWWTGQQIQNIGTGNATIVSTAYDAQNAGVSYMAQAGPIAPGASHTFLPDAFTGMPNGFQGSAVVSSDQPIKAIVTLTNRQVGGFGTAGGIAGGQYQGVDGAAASTTISFPLVKNAFGGAPNIKTTTLFVQNAGSAAAAVGVAYSCPAGTFNFTSAAINPGQMVVLNPGVGPSPVPTGQNCAATVTSTQPIAGVAAEHYDSETTASLVQTTRAFTSADADDTVFAPIFKKNFPGGPANVRSRSTGAQVQNVGTSGTIVTATFVGVGGSCNGQSITEVSPSIAPGSSFTFLNPAGLTDTAGCLASAEFSAGTGGSIVGIVNESFLSPAPMPGTQSSTAYNMAAESSSTAKVVAPLFKEQFGGKTSGLQVQNIGLSPATLSVQFKVGATTYTTADYTVAPGASANFYLISGCGATCWGTNTPLPANSNASVTVNSTQPILAALAEQPYTTAAPNCFGQAGGACYDRMNYEGFNVAP